MKLLKGWFGEKITTFSMWLSLDSQIYQRVHDVIISTSNGTTQIDHLVVSPYGVFIVETKNMKGWIFGSENQSKWTQSLYKNKYTFQNPLRQTYRQKKVLAENLGISESLIHVVIYFVGECKFKTPMPPNVLRSGLGSYIKQYKNIVFTPAQSNKILSKINYIASDPTLTTRSHVQSLHERHSSSTICPKCGGKLIKRVAKKGLNTGSSFLGCKNYPKCRFTKNT